MEKGLIGVQMMMLKDQVREMGAYRVLEKLSGLGFHSVEISQIPMTAETVSELKRGASALGMEISACSGALAPAEPGAAGEYLTTDYEKIVGDCRALGCRTLRVGMLPVNCIGSREKTLDFAKRMDEMAKRLKGDGIALYYHNHHIEFTKYDGKYLLDIIREETEEIGFELDVYWIQYGGESPLRVIPRFENRIRLLHLKDYRIANLVQGPQEARQDFQKRFTANVEFAELGEGNLPLKEIIDTALRHGSTHFIIEQDNSYGRNPFDSLEISARHLRALGYADWF